MMQANDTPVLIVGGGPVGLALSIDLSWRGIRHVLVERDVRAARADHSRMDQVGVRSMEHFRRLGIAAEIEAAGFPRDLRRDCVFATGVLGLELAREPFEADATRATPPFSPQKHELCPQNFFDPVLQAVAARSRVADIRYGTNLVGLEECDGHVSCELISAGQTHVLNAEFVAGCDGSGGSVAGILGVASGKKTTLARSTNIFFQSAELRKRIPPPGAYRYILIGADGVWASMVNIDGRETWRLQVLGDNERRDLSEVQVRAMVERAIGAEVEFRLTSVVPWNRRELVADRFVVGRCFLLGDAAHQFSPTGGYGMNTGLGDAFNLAWKLAAVLEGWGGPRLLSSYESERRPVAIRNAAQATSNFERMRSLDPRAAFEDGSAEALQGMGGALMERMHEEWESMGIHLGYSYGGSPIVIDEDGSLAHAPAADYEQTSRPGARAPHIWLPDGRSTLDLFGHGFVLLNRGEADTSSLTAAAGRAGLPLRCETITDPAACRLYRRKLVLVRPDGHVALACDRLPLGAEAVIDRIRGGTPVNSAAVDSKMEIST
jgi:2-polyprenyl-6-methoxyphenol hydroxylase-like FAD-dependent oxidoreductase